MADFEDRNPRPLVLICGMLSTKDTASFLRHFNGLAQDVLAIPIAGQKSGRTPQDVADAARSVGLTARAFSTFETALQDLRSRVWSVAPRILIVGSLYLAGEVLAANGTWPE